MRLGDISVPCIYMSFFTQDASESRKLKETSSLILLSTVPHRLAEILS